jgi:stage IV sporulation protein FB
MLGQIPETPYDLHFRILGIPTRVHPGFFVISAIMGWSEGWASVLKTSPFVVVLLWTVCVFVSILVHELGHAAMAQRFGWPPHIVLYHFGGLAIYSPTWGHTRGRSILISLAGPGAGFVLFGLVAAFEAIIIHQRLPISPFLAYALIQLKVINLVWGLVNLLPVYPLDGGRVAEEILRGIHPGRGMEWTLKLGIVTGALVALGMYQYLQPQSLLGAYPVLLFLFLAFTNFQLLQQLTGRGGGGYY